MSSRTTIWYHIPELLSGLAGYIATTYVFKINPIIGRNNSCTFTLSLKFWAFYGVTNTEQNQTLNIGCGVVHPHDVHHQASEALSCQVKVPYEALTGTKLDVDEDNTTSHILEQISESTNVPQKEYRINWGSISQLSWETVSGQNGSTHTQ